MVTHPADDENYVNSDDVRANERTLTIGTLPQKSMTAHRMLHEGNHVGADDDFAALVPENCGIILKSEIYSLFLALTQPLTL